MVVCDVGTDKRDMRNGVRNRGGMVKVVMFKVVGVEMG